VFCCSGKLLKHIAVRSDVLKATFGGYSISISGLPYVDVEVADNKCHSPISKTVWEVHNRVFEMIGQRLSANAMDFVLELLHGWPYSFKTADECR